MQLLSLKEYFPFLEEYEAIILDEATPFSEGGNNLDAIESADPVLKYVPKAEFESLSVGERNQRALDRYLASKLSQTAVGRFYERFLGYQFESKGWTVEYHGIVKGYEDLGRDLICRKGGKTLVVQAKCWSSEKTIHEKHIFQLFGTTQLYLMDNEAASLFPPEVKAIFVSSTSFDPTARRAAEWLKIEVRENVPLDKSYPTIKCNINQSSNEKILTTFHSTNSTIGRKFSLNWAKYTSERWPKPKKKAFEELFVTSPGNGGSARPKSSAACAMSHFRDRDRTNSPPIISLTTPAPTCHSAIIPRRFPWQLQPQ